jgi:hypothetical protein
MTNYELRITNWKRLVIGLFLVSCFLFLSTLPVSAEERRMFSLPECGEATQDECGFEHLAELVRSLINFMILLSTILATAAFAWAGIRLLTSGGNPSALTEAKAIFMKVLIGYLWILGAWLLVYTITTALLGSEYSLLGSPNN